MSTDHISVAGSIGKNTPAGRYLTSKGYVVIKNHTLSQQYEEALLEKVRVGLQNSFFS